MSEDPGNADVPVGMGGERADADVGAPRGWYSRGYLPHYDGQNLIQSVTYRLADSLPQEKLKQLEESLKDLPDTEREVERRKQIENWLDAGMGCCALQHPEVAHFVQDSFLHFHRERYDLHAWCIMPNHVHVLVEPITDLATIVQGWKSYSARWVLKESRHLGCQLPDGQAFWMREYWDRYIRDTEHYRNTVNYIHRNPVKAGLCQTPEEWQWSSAYPGNADVPVGHASKNADEDVGAPSS